jgi:hypothetical protein
VLPANAQPPSAILSQTVVPTIGPSAATERRRAHTARRKAISYTAYTALTPDEHACLAVSGTAQLVTRLVSAARLAGAARITVGLACATRHTARLVTRRLVDAAQLVTRCIAAAVGLVTQLIGTARLDDARLAYTAELTRLTDTARRDAATELGSLTQLGSLQGATALPDLMTQHASLMQLDVLPLAHAPLTSLATTRFAAVGLDTDATTTWLANSALLAIEARLITLLAGTARLVGGARLHAGTA